MMKRLYDWVLALAGRPDAVRWLALVAFLESSVFPVPPHLMLMPMCLAQPRRAFHFAIIATLFSVLGALLGYAIGYFFYNLVGEKIIATLGYAQSFPTAACNLRKFGVAIILAKGATPIPFKLLTLSAGFIHMALLPFVGASILSRGFQFFLVGGLFWKFGASIKPFIEKYLPWLLIAFFVAVVGGFIVLHTLAPHHTTPCTEAISNR